VVCLAAIAVFVPAAHLMAELDTEEPVRGGLPPYHAQEPELQLDCWQEGVQVVSERNLRGVSRSILQKGERSLTFRDLMRGGELSVVALDNAFCLVRSDRP
jgi:hypothetical protein